MAIRQSRPVTHIGHKSGDHASTLTPPDWSRLVKPLPRDAAYAGRERLSIGAYLMTEYRLL